MYVVDRNDKGKSTIGHSSNKPSLGREITGTGAYWSFRWKGNGQTHLREL